MSMKSLTVKELIEQLSKVDKDKEVMLSHVGISASDSYDLPLIFSELTVDETHEIVRINFSKYTV